MHSGEAFFDLTVRGELRLRRDGGLVVAPDTGEAGPDVVVTERDGGADQRWVFDTDAATGAAPGSAAPGSRRRR